VLSVNDKTPQTIFPLSRRALSLVVRRSIPAAGEPTNHQGPDFYPLGVQVEGKKFPIASA